MKNTEDPEAKLEELRDDLNLHSGLLLSNFTGIFKRSRFSKLKRTTLRLRKKLSQKAVESEYFDPESHSQAMRLLRKCIQNQTNDKTCPEKSEILANLKAIIYNSDQLAPAGYNRDNLDKKEKANSPDSLEICTICQFEMDPKKELRSDESLYVL